MNEIRLAILVDIHGNLSALTAVLGALGQEKTDGYIVAGDTISRLRENNEKTLG